MQPFTQKPNYRKVTDCAATCCSFVCAVSLLLCLVSTSCLAVCQVRQMRQQQTLSCAQCAQCAWMPLHQLCCNAGLSCRMTAGAGPAPAASTPVADRVCVHLYASSSLCVLPAEEESTLNLQALQEACPNAPWSLTVSVILSASYGCWFGSSKHACLQLLQHSAQPAGYHTCSGCAELSCISA